ncbi:hypothetical protein C8F04DRAFT_1176453 [Mycena alexandri]|uniref:Uncharacterized protein n=1 Tax=Mycena alexandri TaxID=1745969 RepID=A0AAD6TBE9_9AGAR|nr:hypothetical protein C8F04DRAFT_1176453 [Mycena alexandri]
MQLVPGYNIPNFKKEAQITLFFFHHDVLLATFTLFVDNGLHHTENNIDDYLLHQWLNDKGKMGVDEHMHSFESDSDTSSSSSGSSSSSSGSSGGSMHSMGNISEENEGQKLI